LKHSPDRDLPRRSRKLDEFRAREDYSPTQLGRSRSNHAKDLALDERRMRPRVAMADGQSFPAHGAGTLREPRRPAICILMPDLVEPEAPPGIFGMYPAALIPKVLPWLRCDRSKVLHVCSGGLPPGEGIRVDIRPEAKPDIVADGRELPLDEGSVEAVLIDPPYSEHYARELYGTDYPRPSHLLREAVRVVKPNGRIGIVHYIVPNPPDGSVFIVSMGLSMGFGYPMRAISFYEKCQPALFDEPPPPHARAARRRKRGGS
jgi:hypothetical protein